MHFFTYPRDPLPDLTNYILLTPDAPPLTAKDADHGLFLIDGTWRYAEVMKRASPKCIEKSLPTTIKTAYPRRQDVDYGLASVEALFIAYQILGHPIDGLLDNYFWKTPFLDNFNSHSLG